MTLKTPPTIHFAFTPTIVTLEGEVGETATLSIGSHEMSVTLYKEKVDIDIQAYVKSLFTTPETQSVTYSIGIQGSSHSMRSCVALRGAVQPGQSITAKNLEGKFLTDFDTIDVYEGYPRDIAILSDGDTYITSADPNIKTEKLRVGITNLPLEDCTSAPLELYNYALSYDEHVCQQVNTTFTLAPEVYTNGALRSEGGSLLSYNADGGAQSVFDRNAAVTINATPAPGYFLSQLLVDGQAVSGGSHTFTIHSGVPTLQAYFKSYTYEATYTDYQCQQHDPGIQKQTVTINVEVENSGIAKCDILIGSGELVDAPSGQSVTLVKGGSVKVAASTSEESTYRFDGWYVNGQKIQGLGQFDEYTPTESCTLVAIFTSTQPTEGEKQTFSVLVESEVEFMGTVSGTQEVQRGYPVTISASPADDFEFREWRDSNGLVVSEENPYTFIPEEDTWLIGRFGQMKPLITVEVYHSFSGQMVEISASANSPVMSDITITGKWRTVGIAYNAGDTFSITIEKNTLGKYIIVGSDFPVPDIYEHFEIYDLAYSISEDDSYRYSFIVS